MWGPCYSDGKNQIVLATEFRMAWFTSMTAQHVLHPHGYYCTYVCEQHCVGCYSPASVQYSTHKNTHANMYSQHTNMLADLPHVHILVEECISLTPPGSLNLWSGATPLSQASLYLSTLPLFTMERGRWRIPSVQLQRRRWETVLETTALCWPGVLVVVEITE